ncbi:aminoglycoside phosphotransferase [Akanthomyces lecanii RCEF 1005]|uniref:Aminoglycoside phosphotransferase n=1 Tax=Akanthomyces lecanii RCEF 1005 TaxID=1081108 RepID=A0A168FGQ8_CORDF|nr:aminoglycoside phosphotransferase [Akanthomyces lecanii RCEF 1005]
MEHDMDPPIDPPRDVIWSASNHERCYTLGDKWFVKRQLYDEELPVSRDGRLIYPIWDSERLRNEYLATRFIRVHTDIPVQDCRLFLENGLMCFASRQVLDAVPLEDVRPTLRLAALAAVERQMERFILPQLRQHRRSYIGSVGSTIPVFPPQRVYRQDGRDWAQVSSVADAFVLCHNDLSGKNIWLDPTSFRIVAITGWEFAGYFPESFELPLWRADGFVGRQEMHGRALARDLSFFGLRPSDLRNNYPISYRRSG